MELSSNRVSTGMSSTKGSVTSTSNPDIQDSMARLNDHTVLMMRSSTECWTVF